MNLNRFTVLLVLAIFTLTSCSKEEEAIVSLGKYENGIIVTHQGNFGGGNASISYVSYDFGTIENNVFENINNKPLGDVAQSIAFYGDLVYILVNGSNKIEIVNRNTFKSVKTIEEGLSNPRYIAFANGKGYITNWGDGSSTTDDYVAIIDLSTNNLESKTISVEEGPESILAIGNKLYVAHQGGWGVNNKISVIDATADTFSATITLADLPNSLKVDANGDLWVLCGGAPIYDSNWNVIGNTKAGLFKIDISDNSLTSMDFSQAGHPANLLIEGDYLYYYLNGAVYKMDVTANELPINPEITNLSFYSMSIKNGVLYGVDESFTSNSTLTSYNLATKSLIKSVKVNVGAGAINFN